MRRILFLTCVLVVVPSASAQRTAIDPPLIGAGLRRTTAVAIYHVSPSGIEFSRRTREEGLRAALAWRDGPYAPGPAAEHDAANQPR